MVLILTVTLVNTAAVYASNPPRNSNERSKFYDFADQLIDGEIRRPTELYIDARSRARFDRLLRLKKSFLGVLFNTSKERIFK